jgi:hypothetical protein
MNQIADQTDVVIRISIVTKANVKVRVNFRDGCSRKTVKAFDHDFNPKWY